MTLSAPQVLWQQIWWKVSEAPEPTLPRKHRRTEQKDGRVLKCLTSPRARAAAELATNEILLGPTPSPCHFVSSGNLSPNKRWVKYTGEVHQTRIWPALLAAFLIWSLYLDRFSSDFRCIIDRCNRQLGSRRLRELSP